MRATRCRYRPRAWVWVRLAWPGSAAQGKPRRRQARQAVALRRPGKTRKVSPGFEKYCRYCQTYDINRILVDNTTVVLGVIWGTCNIIMPWHVAVISDKLFKKNFVDGNSFFCYNFKGSMTWSKLSLFFQTRVTNLKLITMGRHVTIT